MQIGSERTQATNPSLSGWQGAGDAREAQDLKRIGSQTRQGRAPEDTGENQLSHGQDSKDILELSPEALEQVAKLKARDQQVRAHEAAHMAAGGSLVRGGASFTYQQGPDGRRYAIGGEVSLDASEVPNNPQATIAKAEQLRAAALAPADPSGQDRAVAAQAMTMAAQASAELASQRSTTAASARERSTSTQLAGSSLDLLA
jgi:hypothetical protein